MSPSAKRSDAHDDLAAIILVGGRSSRMGRPKTSLDFGGRSLLAHVVDRVRPWVREIVLVAAPDQELPPLVTDPRVPLTVVYDDHPGEGPLPALARGLAAITSSWALALGCDAPFVQAEVIAHLVAARGPAVDAVIPSWDGRPQPLVALYRRRLLPALTGLAAGGERRMHAITTLPGARLVTPEALRMLDPEGTSFRALNTPEEYAAAVAALATSR